ncbi:MAG: hypothetical protein ABGY43_17495 [bacterium]
MNASPGSVGKPLPSVATEVRDEDGGFPTPDASYLDDHISSCPATLTT